MIAQESYTFPSNFKGNVSPDPVEWVGHVGGGVLAIRSGVAKYATHSERLRFYLLFSNPASSKTQDCPESAAIPNQ